jgi:hypothetical protein
LTPLQAQSQRTAPHAPPWLLAGPTTPRIGGADSSLFQRYLLGTDTRPFLPARSRWLPAMSSMFRLPLR